MDDAEEATRSRRRRRRTAIRRHHRHHHLCCCFRGAPKFCEPSATRRRTCTTTWSVFVWGRTDPNMGKTFLDCVTQNDNKNPSLSFFYRPMTTTTMRGTNNSQILSRAATYGEDVIVVSSLIHAHTAPPSFCGTTNNTHNDEHIHKKATIYQCAGRVHRFGRTIAGCCCCGCCGCCLFVLSTPNKPLLLVQRQTATPQTTAWTAGGFPFEA
jgi:hypothetical protein